MLSSLDRARLLQAGVPNGHVLGCPRLNGNEYGPRGWRTWGYARLHRVLVQGKLQPGIGYLRLLRGIHRARVLSPALPQLLLWPWTLHLELGLQRPVHI